MRQLCLHLAGRGHRVRVIASDLGVPADLPRECWLERPGGYRCWYGHAGRLARQAPHYLPALNQPLAKVLTEPDVCVHLHLGLTLLNVQARRLCRRAGVPYLLTPHGLYVREMLHERALQKRLFCLLFERRVARNARFVQALVPAEVEGARRLGVAPERLRLIPNGVDADALARAEASPMSLAGRCGFPEGEPALLFLARLQRIKGLDLLLPAFAEVCRDLKERWHLVVAGADCGALAPTQRLCVKLGLTERVHFPGCLTGGDKVRALRDAAAFVLPSRGEGMPNAVLEACAAGLPVVVTDCCNLPEIATAGAGYVCRPETPALEAALRQLLAHPNHTELGANARRLVTERFSWNRVVTELERLYRALRA